MNSEEGVSVDLIGYFKDDGGDDTGLILDRWINKQLIFYAEQKKSELQYLEGLAQKLILDFRNSSLEIPAQGPLFVRLLTISHFGREQRHRREVLQNHLDYYCMSEREFLSTVKTLVSRPWVGIVLSDYLEGVSFHHYPSSVL